MSVVLAADTLFLLSARFLHVRRKEMPRTLLTGALAVVTGWGLSNGVNVTQAVLLTKAGVAALPVFFVYLALTVWPSLALRGLITSRIGVGRTLAQLLVLDVALAIILLIAYLEAETPLVAIVAAVVCSVSFEVVLLLFWEFVSEHFNLLEGKRIFPVIAAGISLGYILSGLTVALEASRWRPELLMLGWAAGAGIAALLTFVLDRYLRGAEVVPEESAEPTAPLVSVTATRAWLQALKTFFTVRIVFAMVCSAALLLSVLRISDYLVAVQFIAAADGDLEKLTVLLGNAWSLAYVIQLGLGLVLTPYLLNKAGVKNAILTLPLSAAAAFGLMALAPGLAGAAALFVVRNGIGPGVDDPSQNVLSSALPDRLKPPLKRLLDGLVLPGSAISAGIVLLLTEQGVGVAANDVPLAAGAGCLVVVLGTLWVRALYVQTIYQRLRTHSISVGDLHQAFGDLSPEQFEELRSYVHNGEGSVRYLAAAAIGRLAPERFKAMVADLARSPDSALRKLAYQLAPSGSLSAELLAAASHDDDPWVAAAAAVAGFALSPPWPESSSLLARLLAAPGGEAVAAGIWASATIGDAGPVVAGLTDRRARARLEALRRFGRLGLDPQQVADEVMACLRDVDANVRREALHQVVRWHCPPTHLERLSVALAESMSSSDGVTRRLASEALAAHHPAALDGAVQLLHGHNEIAVATVESLMRSGRRHLIHAAEQHIAELLREGTRAAREAARYRRLARATEASAEEPEVAILRLANENFQAHVVEMCLAALRALHRKRDFATIEAGLRSTDHAARAEAIETLLNLGPNWMVEPLVSLLESDSFETSTLLLSAQEVDSLERKPEEWMGNATHATQVGASESMRNLAALRSVPIFARMSLDDLAGIDRLMITRRFKRGESIFRRGDHAADLYFVREGEVGLVGVVGGRRQYISKVGPGKVIGETALLPDAIRSTAADALSDCVVRVLHRDRLESVMQNHPEILLGMVHHSAGVS